MKFRTREINVFSMSALDLFASALGAFILISIVLMPYFLRVDHEEVDRLRSALEQAQAAEARTQEQLEQAQAAEARTREQLEQAQAAVARTREQLEQAQAAVARTQERLEQAQRDLEQCRAQEASCQEELEAARQSASGLQSCQAELNACEEKLSKTFLAVIIQWGTESHDVDLHIVDAAGKEFYYNAPVIAGRPGELSVDATRGPGVEVWEVSEAPPGQYQVLYNFYATNGNPEPAVVNGGVYHRDGRSRFRERRLTTVGRDNAILVAVVTVGNDGSVEISER